MLMTRSERTIINHEHIAYHDRATCEAAIGAGTAQGRYQPC